MKNKNLIRFLLLTALPLCILVGIMRFGTADDFDLPSTPHLLSGSKGLIIIRDGLNLSYQDLTMIKINLRSWTLEGVNFSNANLAGADLRETTFKNCSFRGANLSSVNASKSTFINCDFEDATITGATISISKDQLRSTKSYKNRSLVGVHLSMRDFSGLDFSRFSLTGSYLEGDLTGCGFTNAIIDGGRHFGSNPHGTKLDPSFTKEQLMSTHSFKARRLIFVTFGRANPSSEIDFSELDLSGFNLTGTDFAGGVFSSSNLNNVNFKNTNLTDAVITNCDFADAANLTLDQIQIDMELQNRQHEGGSTAEGVAGSRGKNNSGRLSRLGFFGISFAGDQTTWQFGWM